MSEATVILVEGVDDVEGEDDGVNDFVKVEEEVEKG